MSRILSIFLVGCLSTVLACSSKTSDQPTKSTAGAAGAAAATATLNATCPIKGGAVEADGGIATYKGQTIGFCCPGCAPKFEAMSDAQKVAALAAHGTKLPE